MTKTQSITGGSVLSHDQTHFFMYPPCASCYTERAHASCVRLGQGKKRVLAVIGDEGHIDKDIAQNAK